MEPLTLITTATAAFNGLKQLVQAGRELEDCMTQLSQWAGAVADLDKLAEQEKKCKHSLFKSLLSKGGKSIQAQAMDAFTAQIKARKQRDELRQLIQYSQGEHGWHEFLRMENKIREERRKTVHAEMERIQKLKDLGMAAAITVLALLTLGLGLLLIMKAKGSI